LVIEFTQKVKLCIRSDAVPQHAETRLEQQASKNKLWGESAMKSGSISRRVLLKSSTAVAAGLVLSPAIIGQAEAATMKMKCSSSLPNDPKYANGRVYYDNLVKHLKGNGLGEQVEVTFFPDNQLGQEIDVINSVKLGVIDLMLSGSSISANLVPLVGPSISAISFPASRSRPRRSRPAPPSRSRMRC
jgi:hypothetical protein